MTGPKGTLVIPAIGVNEPIYFAPLENKTWDPIYWNQRVAHLGGTDWHGNFNTVLVSHSFGPLQHIPDLLLGDEIWVYIDGYQYIYIVDTIYTTHWTDISPVQPTRSGIITLIICVNDEYRYIVQGYRYAEIAAVG